MGSGRIQPRQLLRGTAPPDRQRLRGLTGAHLPRETPEAAGLGRGVEMSPVPPLVGSHLRLNPEQGAPSIPGEVGRHPGFPPPRSRGPVATHGASARRHGSVRTPTRVCVCPPTQAKRLLRCQTHRPFYNAQNPSCLAGGETEAGSSDLHWACPQRALGHHCWHLPAGWLPPGRREDGGYPRKGVPETPSGSAGPGERVNPIIGRLTDGDCTDSPA